MGRIRVRQNSLRQKKNNDEGGRDAEKKGTTMNGKVEGLSYHRLKDARLQEGVSLRSVAKRMKCPVSKVRAQESGQCDVSISDLYGWQRALKIPMGELLAGPMPGLDEMIRQRAGLVRAAKTAHFLVKKCRSVDERRQAEKIVNELCALMPELGEISAWPERRPRPGADYGRAANEVSTRDWHLPQE